MHADIQQTKDRVAEKADLIHRLNAELGKAIIGQEEMISRLLIGLLTGGHVLLEGVPGLAKTTAITALAKTLSVGFQRIQFTPDLLPADLVGTMIYAPADGTFKTRKGPIFSNLILADEINRAPSKVQSALLEAMQERQVTIGDETFQLEKPFLVLATQNPIEQEGTYPLPEAQLDRFLMHIRVGYPNVESERKILQLVRGEARGENPREFTTVSQATIFAARGEVLDLYLAPALEEYAIQLVLATRTPSAYGQDLAKAVRCGASPRGTIALDRCARAHAWLRGAEFVAPEDVQAVAKDVLRHRVLLNFEAEADGMTPDSFLDELIARVPLV